MKKRNVIIVVAAAFVIGIIAGHIVSSFRWIGISEDLLVTVAMRDVSSSYLPLTLLNEQDTDRAQSMLKANLHGALQMVKMHAESFDRPDLLTNSIVKEAIESSEQSPANDVLRAASAE